MDFSSAKRGANPAPAQGRRNDRHRNQPYPRNNPIPPRQRHPDSSYYSSEETPSQYQHDNGYEYNEEQYPDQSSTQWERQPSAHLSEIESVEGSHMGSQQQGDGDYEDYEPDNRLIPAPRGSHDRQNYAGVEQSYDEIIIVEPRHPSQRRIRDAQAVEMAKNTRDHSLPSIGRSGPQPFKILKVARTRGHQTDNNPEPVQHENSQDDQDRYSRSIIERRGFTGPGPKGNFKPSKTKMSQSTKFDTPNEKGSRLNPGHAGSSNTSQRTRNRQNPESDGVESPQVDYTPTAAKVARHRGRKAEPDLIFDIDQEFDESTLLFDGPSDDRLGDDSNNQEMSNIVPSTPPSDRTLALVDDRQAKPNKSKITLSSGMDLGSDGLGDDMMEMFDDVVKDVVPTTKLQLKMPKTVDQVVKHISTVLAKKVAKDQGEIAIKSAENWDWSRLSVLSSEMNEGIKEMEDMIKGAGESEIENVKRKRVDMESQVTAQYEEFRKDFREACEKMQQPAILGKKFKFGPFP